MTVDYIGTDTAEMVLENGKKMELLWGDRVEVYDDADPATVKARGKKGTLAKKYLGGKSLLELYFIDVGQGDGVLIKSPDDRHILIDGGYERRKQPTGKNAADFVDWKFFKDYGRDEIALDMIIASHNDADHYGGLWDLLNPDEKARAELDTKKVTVERFCHAGVSWWVKGDSGRWIGAVDAEKEYLIQLLGDRQAMNAALQDDADQKLQGEWAKFLKCVGLAQRQDGQPTGVQRLSSKSGYLPGFEPGGGKPVIKILGPVEHNVTGSPALRRFNSSDSINVNGNSILLQLVYGKVRLLLTGDLNKESQQALLEAYSDNLAEFACDVAKACHHGSDDVSYKFLSAMSPSVTVISSGDCEGHDHPRPGIIAASATTGHLQIDTDADRIVTPLIYITELVRSLGLGRPEKLEIDKDQAVTGAALARCEVECKQVDAGALNAKSKTKKLDSNCRIVTDLVYGLVNVRTDGEKILCATLNEADATWQVKTVESRF